MHVQSVFNMVWSLHVLTNLSPRCTVAGPSLSTPDTAVLCYSSPRSGTARLVEGPASDNIQQTLTSKM